MPEFINNLPILFIVGLTGVGKSSTLETVQKAFTLLPNRRTLANKIIIPQVLREAGRPVAAVTDRLERFALTARYRELYSGGMVHALLHYLASEYSGDALSERPVFDNIRGLDECRAALDSFPKARFIFLDAPPSVRLKRLVGRSDAFDSVSESVAATRLENTVFAEQLLGIKGAEEVFDTYALARLEATSGISDEAILNAVRIIVEEQKNYDSSAAHDFLEARLDESRLLYLDTSNLSLEQVASEVQEWL